MSEPDSDLVDNFKDLQIGKKTRVLQFKENEIYSVKSLPRGFMLIINNNEWDNETNPTRKGSKQIVEKLEEIGPTFGYKVTSVHDPNSQQFMKSIMDFAKDEAHKDVDSAIIIIMSHGDQPVGNRQYYSHTVDILTRDNERVSSDWIIEQFNTSNCPALAGKPKIIFFITGRGRDEDYGLMIQKEGGYVAYPRITDLLVVYPFQPGYMSTNNEIGSYFMGDFIKILQENWNSQDLYTMLSKVDAIIKEKYENDVFEVVDYQVSGFCKKFFFDKLTPSQKIEIDKRNPISINY